MGIGASIFLVAIGAILVWAVDLDVAGVDMEIVGWIIMAAGAVGAIATALMGHPTDAIVHDHRGHDHVAHDRRSH